MVKALGGWEFDDVAGRGHSYGTTVRRILLQRPMRMPRMVVNRIRRQKPLEMPFVKHDNLVEKLSA